jgi:hypothetical protein
MTINLNTHTIGNKKSFLQSVLSIISYFICVNIQSIRYVDDDVLETRIMADGGDVL